MKDDYLWDGSGEPDLEVVRLERALRPARYLEEKDLPARARPRPRPTRWRGGALAVALAAAAAAALLLLWHRAQPGPGGDGVQALAAGSRASASPAEPGVSIRPLAGTPVVGESAVAGPGPLRPGQWLVTDEESRALIELAGVGEVRVGPQSRVRLVGSGPAERRLELGLGALRATVTAPPRLFLVDVPSATAVDLGCEYELVVDASGAGLLRVTYGEVSLEGHGRVSLVPGGSACETRPGQGPGTPFRGGAPGRLIDALRRFDFESGGQRALDEVLEAASGRDTLTLWHLIERASGLGRERVVARLASLSPPPPGVSLNACTALDRSALAAWRSELEGSW